MRQQQRLSLCMLWSQIRYRILGVQLRYPAYFCDSKASNKIHYKMKAKESCRGVFKKHKILTIYALYIYECLIFVSQNTSEFQTDKSHCYPTRTNDIMYPIHRLTLSEKGTHYRCIKFFNNLPKKLQRLRSHKTFKRELRKYLIDLEPYTIQEFLDSN